MNASVPPASNQDTDGAKLLSSVEKFLGRFISYPSPSAKVAHALWIVHTHLMKCWESTPRLAFLSPEPGSGKTRALEVTQSLVPRPVQAFNVTPPYLFRKVSEDTDLPTLLYDEIDTVFGWRAKGNEDIRAFLNAGHRRGGVAGRCVENRGRHETEELSAYCAVAMAGLGKLPDTILTRSIVVRLRKRKPLERVEQWRRRTHEEEGKALHGSLDAWARSIESTLEAKVPEMPPGIEDRDADVWEPLLAIADAAGGDWPERAREAAVTLVTQSREHPATLGSRLLQDLRTIFGGEAALSTADILKKLIAIEDAPWHGLKGKDLDARRLANFLGSYGVHPKTIRIGDDTVKGYRREDLHDPWTRYLLSA